MSQAQYKSGLCKTHDRQRTERESTEIQRDHGNENRMDLGVIENVINGRWGEEEAHGDKERKTNDDYGNEIAIIESPNEAGTISVPTSEELGKLLTDFAILASTSASEPIAINQQQCQSLNEAGTISVPTLELGNSVTDFAILASEPIAVDKQLNPVARCNAVGCQDTTAQEEVVKNRANVDGPDTALDELENMDGVTLASEPITVNQQQCQSLDEAGTISVPTSEELGNLGTDFAILASEPIAVDKQLNPVARCNAVGCQDTTEQEEVVKNGANVDGPDTALDELENMDGVTSASEPIAINQQQCQGITEEEDVMKNNTIVYGPVADEFYFRKTRTSLLNGHDGWICTRCGGIDVPSLTVPCGNCNRLIDFVPLEFGEFEEFVRKQRGLNSAKSCSSSTIELD